MTSTLLPAHPAGNFAPVPDEITAANLPVAGVIPAALSGWYLGVETGRLR